MGKSGRKILDEIHYEFLQPRKRPVPERLRRLTLSALRDGHSAREVALAAGMTQQSIRNWDRQAKAVAGTTAPVELNLIDAPEPEASAPAQPATNASLATARITLVSGATVDLPVSSLDCRLLVALNWSAS